MAASDSLLAVGSQNHVSLVDSRAKACVSSFANAEHNHGKQTYPADVLLLNFLLYYGSTSSSVIEAIF